MKIKTACLYAAICLGISAVGAGLAGCKGDSTHRSTGRYIDDQSLSVRARSALSDNGEYKFGDVKVTSYRGTVQLSGFVSTSDQKAKAGEIVRGVEGVKNVENNITVKE